MMPAFVKHLYLGTGFTPIWLLSEGGYEASDLPFLALLAQYGIIGTSIIAFVYLRIFIRIKHFRKNTQHFFIEFITSNKHELILAIALITYFYSNVFLTLFNVGSSFLGDYNKIGFCFFIGMLYGILRNIEKRIKLKRINNIVK